MRYNVNRSLTYIQAENDSYMWAPYQKSSALDGFTDSIMLGNAIYESKFSALHDALVNPRMEFTPGDTVPVDSLAKYASGETGGKEVTYARYWHGYLVLTKFDVLVGINLLREGLDLPEVSLVAILDADKEGFLRSETSLIQTMGRAARNAEGKVIMYADTVTPSMRIAMDETARRREIQDAYNKAHGIVPKTVIKSVRDLIEISSPTAERKGRNGVKMTKAEKEKEIARLEKQMKEAAKMMEYEYAAVLRDQIVELRGNGL